MLDGTPLLKFYAKRRDTILQAQNAAEEQRMQLLKLVSRAMDTRFGRDHGFTTIRDVADFQSRVPLRRYEDMWDRYWRLNFPTLINCTWPGRIPYFALSSGTSSGTTKYIPCSHEMNRANVRAALDVLTHHVRNRPESHVLGGKTFMLGGSTDLSELAPGIHAGDLSGIAAARTPFWARFFVYPPRELALIADWEEKIAAIVRGVIDEDIRSIAGTPSWLLIFFERLFAHMPQRERKLHAFFPHLELVIHGGVNFTPYRPQFTALLEGSRAETREVYAASEGFIAVADRAPGEGMRVILDNGLFYEFVPLAELGNANPTRHWIGNAEAGIDYAIMVTSCAGLWAYVMGDTVRFVDLHPPRLLVTGRTSYYLSAFGEHLTGEEIEDAVSTAAAAIGAQIADFAVGSVFPNESRRLGGHLFVVEFSSPALRPAEIKGFLQTIDDVLSRRNDDYRAHRAGGFGLDAPEMLSVAHGTFEAWMKARGRLGGQNKVPRIIADHQLFDSLCQFARARPGQALT
jgi:hypothetical protein